MCPPARGGRVPLTVYITPPQPGLRLQSYRAAPNVPTNSSSKEKSHRIDLCGGISSRVGTQSNFIIALLIVPFMDDEMWAGGGGGLIYDEEVVMYSISLWYPTFIVILFFCHPFEFGYLFVLSLYFCTFCCWRPYFKPYFKHRHLGYPKTPFAAHGVWGASAEPHDTGGGGDLEGG